MSTLQSDKNFGSSVAKFYDEYFVPLIFEPYAEDIARRLATRKITRVLEIAAGTGVVTRRLASLLPEDVSIFATDLNQPMLDLAAELGTARPVVWRQADAMQLPFEDGSFDAVVCQFGAMFFPDKSKAYSEARRVLRSGGVLLFNVWDRIEENEFADVITAELESIFPDDPPRFLERTPHGYHDIATIKQDLRGGGFVTTPVVDTIAVQSIAASARIPALAYCQGTPLRNEIEARDKSRLGEATDIAERAIARRFGRGQVAGKIQAHIVMAEC